MRLTFKPSSSGILEDYAKTFGHPQPGGDEGRRVQGSREPSTISLEARQASKGLGISQVNNDGNDTGRSVPEVGGPLDFMRVPSTDESAPVLPMGKVEESLQRFYKKPITIQRQNN